MRGRRAEVERALALLGASVAERLSGQGWIGRDLSDGSIAAEMRIVATVTRSGDHGVLVAVEIIRTSFRWPPRWPVDVAARLGVGYQPALNLMPMLTLPPRAILVHDRAGGGAAGLPVTLTGPRDVVPAADRIVDWVQQRAPGLVMRFADAAAIDADLERSISAGPARPAKSDGGPKQRPAGIPDRLALLAAMGRHEQTRTLLAAYEADAGSADRRFVRQLRRWLDRGGPQAPPVEETLAVVAPPAREPWPERGQIMATVRAQERVRKAARKATRAQATGKNLEELKTLVATEYGARGVELPSFAVTWYAEMLQDEQRPFGRVRSTLRALRISAAGGREALRMIRDRLPTDPDWLRPPQRASYPVCTDRTRHVPVELDASVRTWMERVQAHAPRHLGPWTLVDAWLTRDEPTGRLAVHIGDQRVGTVRPDDTGLFHHAMTAAAVFDEDPVVPARLTPADNAGSPALLELPVPRGARAREGPAH